MMLPPALRHEWRSATRHSDERIDAHLMGDPIPLARRVEEGPLQILTGRERDRVNKDIEMAELASERLEDRLDLSFFGHIAREDQGRTSQSRGQFAHVLPKPFVLVRERKLCARFVKALGDGPRDAPLVRDAEDDPRLSFQHRPKRYSTER